MTPKDTSLEQPLYKATILNGSKPAAYTSNNLKQVANRTVPLKAGISVVT